MKPPTYVGQLVVVDMGERMPKMAGVVIGHKRADTAGALVNLFVPGRYKNAFKGTEQYVDNSRMKVPGLDIPVDATMGIDGTPAVLEEDLGFIGKGKQAAAPAVLDTNRHVTEESLGLVAEATIHVNYMDDNGQDWMGDFTLDELAGGETGWLRQTCRAYELSDKGTRKAMARRLFKALAK